PILALLMVVFAVATGIARLISRVAFNGTARRVEHDVRSRLFGHLLGLDPGVYRRHPVGDIMSRLSNDAVSMGTLWRPGIYHLIAATVALASIITMMVVIDPVLTLWALVPFPVMVGLGKLFNRRFYKTTRALQAEYGHLATCVQEDLSGIAIIKSGAVEDQRVANFGVRSREVMNANLHLVKVHSQLTPLLEAL